MVALLARRLNHGHTRARIVARDDPSIREKIPKGDKLAILGLSECDESSVDASEPGLRPACRGIPSGVCMAEDILQSLD